MLDIFLSNKIPSSLDGWTDELIRVASIHNEFDGLPYNYPEITDRFTTISNRVPGARDSSDYRDEYGAYVSYLGLMSYEQADNKWLCRVNPQAQELLCSILPDPQAFVRLQMTLLQYPNPIGATFNSNGKLRVEHQSLSKRLFQIHNGVQTVPFRLLLRVLLALNENFGLPESFLTQAEIWRGLFTNPAAVGTFDPDGSALANAIIQFRKRNTVSIKIPAKALRNLHILNHTGLLYRDTNTDRLCLSPSVNKKGSPMEQIARMIANQTDYFKTPVGNISEGELKKWTQDKLLSGEWANYFCGNTLPISEISQIKQSVTEIETSLSNDPSFGPGAILQDFDSERRTRSKRLQSRAANPEETEVLREKANLQHRAIVSLLANRLRARGIKPESNIFVDLCCRVPKKMLFEIKSCHQGNLLSQVRKAISQLYEYRYRHEELQDAKVVIALESRPTGELAWLTNYLIKDRKIALCWLEGEDNLACPTACEDCLGTIVDRLEEN